MWSSRGKIPGISSTGQQEAGSKLSQDVLRVFSVLLVVVFWSGPGIKDKSKAA